MFERTDHDGGHWHVIAGEQKKYGRVAVLETVISSLEDAMRKQGLEVPEHIE